MKEALKKYILEHAFDGWKDSTDDNVMKAIDDFFYMYKIDENLDMSEWISVKDQPAPKDVAFIGYVLLGYHCDGIVDNRNKEIQVCEWDDYDKYIESCNCSGYERDREWISVTHWMPLPNPPVQED